MMHEKKGTLYSEKFDEQRVCLFNLSYLISVSHSIKNKYDGNIRVIEIVILIIDRLGFIVQIINS